MLMEVIQSQKYHKILDIGCAKGYYAVGFAMKLPDIKIIAYDINEEARQNSEALKSINHIINLEIKAECTHSELNLNCDKNTLIFCEIEGYEEVLLDPIKAPNIRNADMIIEFHDCFVPNITEEIIKIFYQSHKTRIIVDYPFRVKTYTTPNEITKDLFQKLTNEKRSKYMKYIFLESHKS